MNDLFELITNEINLDNLLNYEEITTDISNYINDEITKITKDDETYYIIKIHCDYCGNNRYYISVDGDIDFILHNEEFQHNYDYDVICPACYDDDFNICEDCGEIFLNDESIYVDSTNQYICQDCYGDHYFTCNHCSEIYHDDDMNEYNGEYYCSNCYEEICENCNFDYNDTTNRTNENIDKPLNEYSNCNAVCDYHDNPIDFEFRKIGNEQTNLYFGVELEITNEENKTAKASHFIANNLFCRVENDSSINNYGFEIISDPATLNFWNNRKNKIKQVFEELTKNGYISHNDNSCGLHIHASKKGLGDTTKQIDKTINNLVLICENFKKELQIFSRRDSFRWCHFLYDDDVDGKKETNIEKIKDNKSRQGRYSVINLNNENTIEFRLNRGTLNINTFYASLQLFYNMIELAKKDNITGVSWCQLINMNDFNELKKYNKERKIKGYNRIKETSEIEKIKELNEDLKALKKREKSLPTYRKIQEFRFDMLKKLNKYENITNNEFYSYCVSSSDRDIIYNYMQELKRTMSELNNYIVNNTFKRYCQNNDIIQYYVFNKNKIIELKNNIIQAYNNYINLDIFQYIFGDTEDIKLIKIKENKTKKINLKNAIKYQAVIICKPNKFLTDTENGEKLKNELQKIIKKYGNIEKIENMGVKNLAYTIQTHTKGHYFTIDFLTESQNITEIERYFRINDNILKFIIIKVEE